MCLRLISWKFIEAAKWSISTEDNLNNTFSQLKQHIEAIPDTEQKEISMAMSVLVMAYFVDPNLALLAKNSGYPKAFVDSIATRMQEAGLWHDGIVDAGECVDQQGETHLKYKRLWAHALVALGQLKRYRTSDRYLYVDASTGQPAFEWNDAGEELC